MHSGDSACMIPPVGLSAGTIAVHRGLHPPHRRGARRPGPDQRAVRGEAARATTPTPPRCSSSRPTPAPVAHRAVRGQGHRRAAGEGRGPRRCAARRSPSCATRACCDPPVVGDHIAVKEAVLPFSRFPDVRRRCSGPEMRSTGEVMGIDLTVGQAFAKSQLAAGDRMPTEGTVFMSLADRDKRGRRQRGRTLRASSGFSIVATEGTAEHLLAERASTVEAVVSPRCPTTSRRRGQDAVDLIADGRSSWSSTRRVAAGPGPTAPTSAPRPGATTCRCSRPRRPRSPRPTAWPRRRATSSSVRPLQEYHAGVRTADR